jgi:ABC-type protease/lipase transport system fused ATPase/permease subunit
MFIIAHRVSTLSRCDRIMVFDKGEMVAFEAPDVLAEHSAFYREVRKLAIGGEAEAPPDEAIAASTTGETDSEQ